MTEKEEAEDLNITAFDDPTEEPEEVAEEEVKGETETEETAEAETEETESETPSQESHIPIAALTAERRKRQEAAAKLEHYEDIPDPVEQPKEYAEFVRNQAQVNSLQERINLSRSIMVDLDPEYESYEQEFMSAVARNVDGKIEILNQDLYSQFTESPNPAKFARDMGRDIRAYKERMDPNYEQNLRRKWEAEQSMPDLTEATAEGSNSEPVEEPADLTNVFDGSPL